MGRKIIIYKNIDDYNNTFDELRKKYSGLQMLIVDKAEKVGNFSFIDYSLIITYNFNRFEKVILSDKVKIDSRKSNLQIQIQHIEGD